MGNTLWGVGERLIHLVFGLFPFILISRLFEKNDIAMYSIVSMMLFNIWSLSSFNSRGIYIKYAVLYGNRFKYRYFPSFLINKVIFFVSFGSLSLIYLYSIDYLSLSVILAFLIFMFTFHEPYLWDLESNFKQKKIFFVRLVISLFSLVIKLYVVLYVDNIELLFVIISIELLVFHGLFYFRANKTSLIKYSLSIKNWLFFTKKTLPLLLSGLVVFAYSRIDQLMLVTMVTAEEVADYSVVLKLIEPLNIIPGAICATVLPLATCEKKSGKNYLCIIKGYISITFYLSLIIALFFIFFGSGLVALLFGGKFSGLNSLIYVLSSSIPLSFLAIYNGMLLVLFGKQSLAPIRAIFGFCVNVVLNLLLIPKYGSVGAALATFVTLLLSGPLLFLVLPATREIGMLNIMSPFTIKSVKSIKHVE